MGMKLANNAVSRLEAGIAAGATSISITPGDGAKFPVLSAGDYFPATLIRASDGAVEIIRVTARSTDVLTVARGQENTTALAFVSGDRIELRLTAGAAASLTEMAIADASNKATLVDADEFGVVDSAASNVIKGHTWANLKAGIWTALGVLINGGTDKATPVDADTIAISDSAASSATKKLTWANIKATLKTYFDAQYLPISAPTVRNRIINGRMQIDQRNAGALQTFTAGAAVAYCVDRFYAYCTGANITGQRLALSNGQNRYRFYGAAGNTYVMLGQRIEALNSLDLAGQTVTLQAKLSSTSVTNVFWQASRATVTDSFSSQTDIASGLFTISGTEGTYSTQISIPTSATMGIQIEFRVLSGLPAGQTLTIGDVQLEQGSVALPVEIRPYGQELALCQRYYEKSYNLTTKPGTAATSAWIASSPGPGNYLRVSGSFRADKRAAPTMVLYNPTTGATGTVSIDGEAKSATIFGKETAFSFYLNNIPTIVDQFMSGHWTAEAEL